MSRSQMRLPVQIRSPVAPLLHRLPNMPLRHAANKRCESTLTAICSGVQTSRSTDLTLLIWVPIERWMPEHRMHRKTPLHIYASVHKLSREARLRTDSKRPIAGLCVYTQSQPLTTPGRDYHYTPLRLQSAHVLFSGLLRSSLSVRACLSVVALSCL